MFTALKSFGKHFIIYGVGRVLGKLVAFALIPLYTHYLTTAEYGTLELLELTTYVVGMFVAAGIGQSVMRFYYETDVTFTRRVIVSTSLISVWTISLVTICFLMLLSSNFSRLVFESPDNAGLFRLVFLSMMISLTNEIPLSFIRAQQKSTLFITISISQLIIALSLNILFIVGFGWGIRGIILSGIINQGIAGLLLTTYTFRYSGFHFSWPWLKKIFRYGLPFIPAGLCYFVLNFTDRFFLQRFESLSDVGIYGLGYKFGMILSPMITEPFLSIFHPKIFEIEIADDAKKFVSLILTYLMFLEFFVGLGISVLVQDAFRIMVAKEFWPAYKIVPLIILSYILVASYTTVEVGMLIYKKTKWVAFMVGVAAALNVGLNLLLIPKFGYWGAAYATLISYVALLILCYIIANRFYPVKYEGFRLFKILLAAILIYFTAINVHFESVYIALLVKGSIVIMFPIVLYLLRFYTQQEINKIKMVNSSIATFFKIKFSY